MVPAAEIYRKPVPGWEAKSGRACEGIATLFPLDASCWCLQGWCWRAPCMVCLAFVMPVFLLFSQVLVPVTLTIGMVMMGLTGENSLWTLTTPFANVLNPCAASSDQLLFKVWISMASVTSGI
jgi:hypothetical protein